MRSIRLGLLVIITAALGWGWLNWQDTTVSGANRTVKVDSVPIFFSTSKPGSNTKLDAGELIATEYAGDARAVSALAGARPTGLATGDFDRDGVPDLISGYQTDRGGVLTLHRGNELSIFPGGRDARGEKLAPFHSRATVTAVPASPDLIAVGDFNDDIWLDVVTAERGAVALNYFKGNGRGEFSLQQIAVEGTITAMTAGSLNRDDGSADLAVAVVNGTNARVIVFEGTHGALNEPAIDTIELPATATKLVGADLDQDSLGELIVAAGNELLVVRGRDRKLTSRPGKHIPAPVLFEQKFSSAIVSVTTGTKAGEGIREVLALDEMGAVHSVRLTSSVLNAAGIHELTRTAGPGTELISAQVSASSSSGDLLVIDRLRHNIEVLTRGGKLSSSASITGASAPVAVIPMRLNKDGLDDLVILSEGQIAPAVVLTNPQAIFTVNSNGSGDDLDPGNGLCLTSVGTCTLSAAVQESNALAGADEIRFNLPGSAPFTIAPVFFTATIVQTVTIDATTQPGFAGAPIVELSGASQVINPRGLEIGSNFNGSLASNSVVRGLVINRYSNDAINLDPTTPAISNVRIEGCYVGTDVSGTVALPTGSGIPQRGAITISGVGHTIGGTTAAARNVISGNNGNGLRLGNLSSTIGVIVQGNYIGTDKNGTTDLGNSGDGVRAGFSGGSGTIIGGSAAGSGNVISGNGGSGLSFGSSSGSFNGLVVEGNRIGTDLTGNIDLGNDNRGVRFDGFINSRIGGTSDGSRNVVSGNGQDGIELRFCSAVNVQGNYVGTKADGRTPLPNGRNAILLTTFTGDSLIGGGTPVVGDNCNAPCNVFSFGATGRGISISNANVPNPFGGDPDRSERRPELSNDGNGNELQGFIMALFDASQNFVDLGNNGSTPDDPGDDDDGENRLQNKGKVDRSQQVGTLLRILYSMNSDESRKVVGLFGFAAASGGRGGAGGAGLLTFIGQREVIPDANGNSSFTAEFPIVLPPGSQVVAIVTDAVTGDTSENTAFVPVEGAPITSASVSGRVMTPSGQGLMNAYVTIANGMGVVQVVRTSSFGFYQFENIATGAMYTISVSSKRYLFDPRVVNVNGVLSEVDFMAQGPVGRRSFRDDNDGPLWLPPTKN